MWSAPGYIGYVAQLVQSTSLKDGVRETKRSFLERFLYDNDPEDEED